MLTGDDIALCDRADVRAVVRGHHREVAYCLRVADARGQWFCLPVAQAAGRTIAGMPYYVDSLAGWSGHVVTLEAAREKAVRALLTDYYCAERVSYGESD
jgi:hypothetical protein